MSKGIGRLIQIAFAREATRGTAETSPAYWIPFAECSVEDKDERVSDDQARGVIVESVGEDVVSKWSEITATIPIEDKSFPLFLYSVLGSLSTGDDADSDASIKDHTITELHTTQHPTLTTFLHDPVGGTDYVHALSVITQLEINYEQKKYVSAALTLRAKKGASVSTLTPSSTSGVSRFLPQHVTFKMASTQAGLTAASATTLKSAKLRFTHNVEPDENLGSVDPGDHLTKTLKCEGTLELLWQGPADFQTAALALTAKALRFDLKNTDVTIGNAANPQIRIDLHKVTFKPVTKPVRLNDMLMQTVTFSAHYNLTDAKMAQALAVNAVASY